MALKPRAFAASEKASKPKDKWQPAQVILFSGHRVDEPGRNPARFPDEKKGIAAKKIGEALDKLGAGPNDLALCQAASGGDLLFLAAAEERGVRCEVLLPFAEPEFIEKSILPSQNGERWRKLYSDVKEKLIGKPRIMPVELGPLPQGVDPYERCNLWLLDTALAWGADKVRFICLWNGSGGSGPGGTEHMYKEVERRTGRVTWIDTRKLW